MKLNVKDLIAGGLLIAFAAIALWLNTEHTLGSARRMGPGYMPMLSFFILMGLAGLTFLFALFNGPDPIATWTKAETLFLIGGAAVGVAAGLIAARLPGFPSVGWNPLGIGLFVGCMFVAIVPSWRPLFLVSAAFTLFGIVLEPIGFMLAIALCVIVAAYADRTHIDEGQGLPVWLVTTIVSSAVVLAILFGIVEGVTWLSQQLGQPAELAEGSSFLAARLRALHAFLYSDGRVIGLVAALVASIVIMVKLESGRRSLGVGGLVGFLAVLCYLVFIYELDIRVPVWPQF